MSDWPELERRLIASAQRRAGRRRRTWVRFASVPVAAAIAVALVALIGSPDPADERSVPPASERPVLTPTATAPDEPTGPGTHGTRVDDVAYAWRSLRGGTVNRLAYRAGERFVVAVTNQGDNDEVDVKVVVRVRSGKRAVVTLARTVTAIAAGERVGVELPLDREPPIDRALTIDVTVAKVPGEKTDDPRDDNRRSFPALFSAASSAADTPARPVDVADLRDTEPVRQDLASGGELVRAWKVSALEGHVHLIRKPDEWCLSVPDPLTDHPEIERGKTCTTAATFAARGIQIGIGSTSVSVGPDPDAPLSIDP